MKTYTEAKEVLKERKSKKIGNNTYLEQLGNGSIGVKLHNTHVVTYRQDGSIILDSGGWRTMTTKDRINTYSPISIYQDRGNWYLNGHLFFDGIKIDANGKDNGKAETKEDKKKQRQMKEGFKSYSRKFIDALHSGKVPAPSGGDCWHCSMRTNEGQSLGDAIKNIDHLEMHIKENYFVPSLLVNALKEIPSSIAERQTVYAYMQNKKESFVTFINDRNHFIFIRLEDIIYKYLKRKFQLA